jgi:molybdopterin synthase catalytic subunit
MPDFAFVLSEDVITDDEPAFASGEGAEARFLGVVRDEEDGRRIRGIDYSAYVPMAEKVLGELLERGHAEGGAHRVFVQHRLGFVAAEEPSILIRVRTRHSAAAFDLCHWYLRAIKTSVPIWKQPVFAEAALH